MLCQLEEIWFSSLSSNSLIGSKENMAQDNISPVADGYLSDLNLSSPKFSVSSLSASLVGRENLENNISPVITGFQCDFNLSSPKLSVSSLSSSLISPRAMDSSLIRSSISFSYIIKALMVFQWNLRALQPATVGGQSSKKPGETSSLQIQVRHGYNAEGSE